MTRLLMRLRSMESKKLSMDRQLPTSCLDLHSRRPVAKASSMGAVVQGKCQSIAQHNLVIYMVCEGHIKTRLEQWHGF